MKLDEKEELKDCINLINKAYHLDEFEQLSTQKPATSIKSLYQDLLSTLYPFQPAITKPQQENIIQHLADGAAQLDGSNGDDDDLYFDSLKKAINDGTIPDQPSARKILCNAFLLTSPVDLLIGTGNKFQQWFNYCLVNAIYDTVNDFLSTIQQLNHENPFEQFCDYIMTKCRRPLRSTGKIAKFKVVSSLIHFAQQNNKYYRKLNNDEFQRYYDPNYFGLWFADENLTMSFFKILLPVAVAYLKMMNSLPANKVFQVYKKDISARPAETYGQMYKHNFDSMVHTYISWETKRPRQVLRLLIWKYQIITIDLIISNKMR